METCLFCAEYERGHPATVEYVCGICVQKLININAEDGRQLYNKTENSRQKKAISIVKRIK